MSKTRRRKAAAMIGETGIGKTTQAIRMIDAYDHGMVTILDYQGEDELAKYGEITLDQIPLQKSGKYRVVTTDWKRFVDGCLQNYHADSEKRGLIVFDDASAYIPSNEWKPLTDLLVGVRHKRLDVILIFHQLWRVPPYIMDNVQTLILFKTGEAMDKDNPKRFRHGGRIMAAFENVAGNIDPHHFEIVELTGIQSPV